MSIAASPVDDGADPPDWLNNLVPAAIPDVTRDTRIPSMLASDKLVLVKASVKSPPLILSKALAGKLVSDVQ